IIGSRAFWACFSVQFPSKQYQYGFLGDRQTSDDNLYAMRRFLSVNPLTGAKSYNKILMNPNRKPAITANVDYNARCEGGAKASVLFTPFLASGTHLVGAVYLAASSPTFVNGNTAGNTAHETIAVTLNANLFSSMERRIAVEIGCSLPIKNSPMVDHQRETPDFVIGRWMWRSDTRLESNDKGGSVRYGSAMPGSTEYQGAQDRITYHELQAQAKIQTFRVRLFARVRAFNEANETWTMRVVSLPTTSTDWWHARIHFVGKD
ncbi:MAG: hypothetical protein CMH98_17355, partial [Oceanospirillaceae bacterium]|nr:hypothetical protein [Oceanospirillaceae bacterium]